MLYKKSLIGILILFTLNIALPSQGENALILPKGWTIINSRMEKISSHKGKIGLIERYNLEKQIGRERLEIIKMTGKAFGELYIPEEVSCDDRPLGIGAVYRTIKIKDYRAILESYPYIGRSVTISPQKGTVITFESKDMTDRDMIFFIERFSELN